MTKKQLKAKAEKALEYLEEVSRSYDYRTVYCVNVKRYGDYIDIDDLIGGYSKRVQEAIKEEFTDEHINDLHWHWLEYEGEYFCKDFLTGCTINSAKHYQELRELVKAGKPTIYPYIDRRLSIKSKLTLIDMWDKNDRKIETHLSYIDIKTAGLYGRMGGWFGVRSDVASNLENLLFSLSIGDTMAEIDASHDITGYFSEVDAIQWVLNEAKKFNDGLSFEEELKYRIEEFVSDLEVELKKEKEVKTAKTLAEKHGYLLARAI